MSLYYADSSAIARAYLEDEPEHEELRELLLEGRDPVLTSELASVELTAAMAAAARARRIADAEMAMRQIDSDLSGEPVAQVALQPATVFPLARRLIGSHALFAIDAIHVAVALADGPRYSGGSEVVFVTCDDRQASAASSEGLSVWSPGAARP